MIAVIDYGAGNLRSVSNALSKLGHQPRITSNPDEVTSAEAVIFPGVGAAGNAMDGLKRSGLDNAIRNAIQRGKPVLAICIGMQMLFSHTEEDGGRECLDILSGTVERLPDGLKVPHMGWNQVQRKANHAIFDGIPDGENFYFVHSYYPKPSDDDIVAATTDYGLPICSAVIKDNIIATQFHPEKSGEPGLKMYANFLKIAGVEG